MRPCARWLHDVRFNKQITLVGACAMLPVSTGPPGGLQPPDTWHCEGKPTMDILWKRIPGVLERCGGTQQLFWSIYGADDAQDTFWLDRWGGWLSSARGGKAHGPLGAVVCSKVPRKGSPWRCGWHNGFPASSPSGPPSALWAVRWVLLRWSHHCARQRHPDRSPRAVSAPTDACKPQ